MRKSPLLILLLFFVLGTRVCVADDGAASPSQASTVSLGTVIATSTAETTYEGTVAEPGRTATGTFDLSYLLVLSLGLAGLFWVRKQSQTL